MLPVRADEIDACLPQTQCTRCSYPCCRDYALAISRRQADINQCPPGGDITIRKLAAVTGRKIRPLDPEFGEFQPKLLAFIHEEMCIGCVLCIQACPVDAIVGSNKLMHTVIQSHCTGCELCLPVCPTDCIEMQAPGQSVDPVSDWPGYSPDDISLGKIRYEQRQQRLSQQSRHKTRASTQDKSSRQQAILEAVKRTQKMKKK